MTDLIKISEAVARFPLGERRIRQLATAGMGQRQGGRWFVSATALHRHFRGLPADAPPRHELADMIIRAGEALRDGNPAFSGLMSRVVAEWTEPVRLGNGAAS